MKRFTITNNDNGLLFVKVAEALGDLQPEWGNSPSIIEEDVTVDPQAARWATIRTLRNSLLAECDYTQLADAPLNSEEKQVWRVYRQALRDLPQQSGDPDNITWPEKP